MRTKELGFAVLVATWGCGGSAAPRPASTHEEVTVDADEVLAESRHFIFHANDWLNLHHFLYQWARSEVPQEPDDTTPLVDVVERATLENLPVEDREIWATTMELYRAEVVARELLFGEGMSAFKEALSSASGPSDAMLTPTTRVWLDALRRVMPVYRRHFLPNHSESNRRWVSQLVSRLESVEASIADPIAVAYGSQWPQQLIRVDVVAYANWSGSYTSNDPDHIVLASTDSDIQGHTAVEMLFHEASHTAPHEQPLRAAIEGMSADVSPRLWHVILFYTAGELTRRALVDAGVDDYVEYAERTGVYERGMSELIVPVKLEWARFLDGEITRDSALQRIVDRLEPHSAPSSSPAAIHETPSG